MKTIQEIIDYMEATPNESWTTKVVKTNSGGNCFFGHLFDMGKDQTESNVIWGMFEEMWATTYMIYPVNDGEHPKYQQSTVKERVIAYLKDLRDGKEKNTQDHMKDYEDYSRDKAIQQLIDQPHHP